MEGASDSIVLRETKYDNYFTTRISILFSSTRRVGTELWDREQDPTPLSVTSCPDRAAQSVYDETSRVDQMELDATREEDKSYENMACEVVTRLEFT